MHEKKEYKTLRWFANATESFGWLLVILSVLIGIVGGYNTGGVIGGIFFGIIAGFFLGLPIILAGQIVSVFLDMRELLADISENIKKAGRGTNE